MQRANTHVSFVYFIFIENKTDIAAMSHSYASKIFGVQEKKNNMIKPELLGKIKAQPLGETG